VLNRASALTIQAIGWDAASAMFYRVMTARLRGTSDFADYRNQVVDECVGRYGESVCNQVTAAFADVGL